MFRKTIISASLGAALALCAAGASAAPVTFFGEDAAGGSLPIPISAAAGANFLSSLVGVSSQSFETQTTGATAPIAVTFGADTATITGTLTVLAASGAGRFATDGTKFLETRPGMTLTFSSPQAAFGFYATDIGDYGGQLSLSFDGGPAVNVPHTIGVNGNTNGHAIFFGYIDTANPFTSVTFINTNTGDAFGFDNFTIGRVESVVIPEPGTLALVGLGLMGFVLSRRKTA